MTDGNDDCDLARENLLLLCRLVIRGLLESFMTKKQPSLPSDHPQLRDLFVMVEKVLLHGLKPSKGVLAGIRGPHEQLWSVLERLGKQSKEAEEAVNCIQLLPSISSTTCKVRAWLRLALMQKKLADYIQLLADSKDIVKQYYEPWAVMCHETSSVVFAGSLIGLRVIDANLFMKEAQLAAQGTEVDLATYIKLPTLPMEGTDDDPDSENTDKKTDDKDAKMDEDLKMVLDQKNYLEERNKFLTLRLSSLQDQLDLLRAMNKHNTTSDSIKTVLTGSNNGPSLEDGSEEIVTDPTPGGSTMESSGSGTEKVNLERLEARLRETETAMELMEKDVHEKQDTIIMLRSQIDDIKKINLDLYQKLRSVEESSRHKDSLIVKLEKAKDQTKAELTDKDLKLKDMEAKLGQNNTFLETLRLELRKKTEFSASIQSELADTRERLTSMETANASERSSKAELETRVKTLKTCEQAYALLEEKFSAAQHQIKDYEQTLEEMGVHLEKSKLTVDGLKESVVTMTDAQWESDKEATSCKTCTKSFSVSRRKHPCRNCGGIFCNTCSENTMPLPAFQKPVRVCDACYELLLKRFSTRSTVALP